MMIRCECGSIINMFSSDVIQRLAWIHRMLPCDKFPDIHSASFMNWTCRRFLSCWLEHRYTTCLWSFEVFMAHFKTSWSVRDWIWTTKRYPTTILPPNTSSTDPETWSLPESERFQLKISAVPLTRFPAVEDQLKASSVSLPGAEKIIHGARCRIPGCSNCNNVKCLCQTRQQLPPWARREWDDTAAPVPMVLCFNDAVKKKRDERQVFWISGQECNSCECVLVCVLMRSC